MRISSIKLRNFLCFGPAGTTIDLDNITCCIGTNGAGKTAALRALCRLFGTTQTQRRLQPTDFHVAAGERLESREERELTVEVRIEFPELISGDDLGTIPEAFARMVVDEPGATPYCRIRLEGKWTKSPVGGGYIDESINWVTSSASDSDEKLQSLSSHDRARIQVYYVPASRDMAKQLANVSGTLLHQLLSAVIWKDELKQKVKAAADNLRQQFDGVHAVDLINQTSKTKWNELYTDNIYATPTLDFAATDFDTVLKNAQMIFGPTLENAAHDCDRLSEGQQSLFYFAFINTLFSISRQVQAAHCKISDSTDNEEIYSIADHISCQKLRPAILSVFAIEEPENHLAPHYLGRIMKQLIEISRDDCAQVLVTSHSSSIVSRIDPERIRYFRMDHGYGVSEVRPITLPPESSEAVKYIKEAVRSFPELYFARVVVLCEGDSEEIVLPKIAAVMDDDLDAVFVSVVPLGGRHVNHLWRLLNDLGIPHVTLLDFDRERKTGGWASVKYVLKELLKLHESAEFKSGLLSMKNGGVTYEINDDDLDKLHTLPDTDPNLQLWCSFLRRYDVFFSYPLDLDYSLLSAFPEAYKSTAADGDGPNGCDEEGNPTKDRIEASIPVVLGSKGGDGSSYMEDELSLFPWYTYLFFGRGKPTTHSLALLSLPNSKIKANLPEPLKALLDRIKEMLAGVPEP